jgi:hypothetical protein
VTGLILVTGCHGKAPSFYFLINKTYCENFALRSLETKMMIVSVVTGVMWKSSGVVVQLIFSVSYYS